MIGWLVLLQIPLTIAVSGPPTAVEYLPLRVAQARGHFAREGLEVALQNLRAEALAAEALADGRATLAATSLDAALRHGHRQGAPPRLVFGLTAAPPAVLLVATGEREAIRTPADLAGKTVAIPAPGAPEHLALAWILQKAGIPPPRVRLLSLGERGAARALASGDAAAAVLSDPWATRLVEEGYAAALVDWRRRGAPARTLGAPTVHAAVFARADTAPGAADIGRLARALLGAIEQIQAAAADDLAAGLPPEVLGSPADFALRLGGAREAFLGDGWVTAEMLEASVGLARERAPLPARPELPRRLGRLLMLEPLAATLGRKP